MKPTNWTKAERNHSWNADPCARHLDKGDILTEQQARKIQDHTLADYGFKIIPYKPGLCRVAANR